MVEYIKQTIKNYKSLYLLNKKYQNQDFPIFNFADIAIVISMFSLVFLELRGEKNDSK